MKIHLSHTHKINTINRIFRNITKECDSSKNNKKSEDLDRYEKVLNISRLCLEIE